MLRRGGSRAPEVQLARQQEQETSWLALRRDQQQLKQLHHEQQQEQKPHQDDTKQQLLLSSSGGAQDRVTAAALAAVVASVPPRPRGKARQAAMTRLKSYEDLPDFLKDNEYIVGAYRPEQGWRDSVRTLFVLHNETGNVWTHFLGFFLFLALALFFVRHPPTPLALTAEHLESLLSDAQAQLVGLSPSGRVAALSSSIGGRVAALEGRIADSAHAALDSISHGLQDGLNTLSGGIHGLQDGLQDGLHHLHDGLRSGRLVAQAAALRSALSAVLAPVVTWPVPRWPVYVYFAGACICLLTSGICHLLGCCSRHIAEMVWRFDYAGIAVLIVASFVPSMYYAFLCQPWWRHFYLCSTTVMGLIVIALSLPSCFQSPKYRAMRACLFTGLGAWGIVPVTQLLLWHGHVWAIRRAFQLDLLMGAIYLAGAATYAARVPERWAPGRFDLFGHSHQLWHAAVVLAAWVHYCAVLVLLAWRDASGGCAVPASVNGPVAKVLGALHDAGNPPLAGMDGLNAALSAYAVRRASL